VTSAPIQSTRQSTHIKTIDRRLSEIEHELTASDAVSEHKLVEERRVLRAA